MDESNSRVIFVDKSRRYSTGLCWITKSPAGFPHQDNSKYITRTWFAVDEDSLTPSQANNYLTDGEGRPYHEDILYLIISLRGNERPRFNGDDDALAEVMRVATTEAIKELEKGVEARRLVWVARTHPDYPNPCVKILINRDIGRGRSKALRAFPRRLRATCSDAFLKVFDETILSN